jgi:chromate reductase
MTTVLGLSGSLRHGSLNTLLLNAAVQLMPADSQLTIGSIRGIPLYDGDLEQQEGIPAVVAQLKDQIAAADGLLLVTPEYNASIPGVFKNAIDWLTRPSEDIARVFRDRPVAVIGASPGPFGTTHAQLAWATVLRRINTRPFHRAGQITVLHAAKVFDPQGRLQDERLRARLSDYLRDFVEFARR